MPLPTDRLFFQKFDFRPQNGTSASFPSISGSVRAPVLRFLAFGSKIDQDSSWYIHQDESWSILLPNARKRSTGALHRAEMLGNEALGAVLDEMHRNTH